MFLLKIFNKFEFKYPCVAVYYHIGHLEYNRLKQVQMWPEYYYKILPMPRADITDQLEQTLLSDFGHRLRSIFKSHHLSLNKIMLFWNS